MLARNHFQKSLSRKSYKFAHFHEKWNDIYVACYETRNQRQVCRIYDGMNRG